MMYRCKAIVIDFKRQLPQQRGDVSQAGARLIMVVERKSSFNR